MCFLGFFFINYALKGLLVASSHTIKLCRSFHIKKEKKNPCCESNKQKFLNFSSLLIKNQIGNKECLKQCRKFIKECKNSMGEGNQVLLGGAYASEYILQTDIHRMVNKV